MYEKVKGEKSNQRCGGYVACAVTMQVPGPLTEDSFVKGVLSYVVPEVTNPQRIVT